MSRKTLFWIAFFALSGVEASQVAFSQDQSIAQPQTDVMANTPCHIEVSATTLETKMRFYNRGPSILL